MLDMSIFGALGTSPSSSTTLTDYHTLTKVRGKIKEDADWVVFLFYNTTVRIYNVTTAKEYEVQTATLTSDECRTIRDCCIFRINGLEVFFDISPKMSNFAIYQSKEL